MPRGELHTLSIAAAAALAMSAGAACSGGAIGAGGDGGGDDGDDDGDGSGMTDAGEPADCRPAGDHLDCTYKTVGELAIEASVHGAGGGGARPAILWIHGGALIFGHRVELEDAAEQLELYLDRGYAVVSIDYRLGPVTKLDEIQQDVADAHAWLRRSASELGIDPDRIGVVGHSAGAYLALSLGFRVEPRPRALVSFYGYGSLGWYAEPSYLEEEVIAEDDPDVLAVRNGPPIANTPLSELDRRGTFYLYCRQTGRWTDEIAGRDPATDGAFLSDYEPLQNVGADYPPTILLHGQMDDDVPFAEATAMFDELRDAGVEVDFVHDGLPEYAGSFFEHGFDEDMDAPGVRAAFEEALDFLDAHVAGAT